MSASNARRAKKGIIASIHDSEGGRLRLVFDDAHSDSDEYPQLWRSGVFITHNEYDAEAFNDLRLSDEQFREIGENLVAFLAHRRKLLPAR